MKKLTRVDSKTVTLTDFRIDLLKQFGTKSQDLQQLLNYNKNPIKDIPLNQLPSLPLQSEPHLSAWEEYSIISKKCGVLNTLQQKFPQLNFPIQEKISQTEAYLSAIHKGKFFKQSHRLKLNEPQNIDLSIHLTSVGKIPILIAHDREDFVTLVRAFSMRNEPVPIPASMGACIVTGYNNWDRIYRHQKKWKTANPFQNNNSTWPAELLRLKKHRALYQDTFILMSNGPYSGVSAHDLGLLKREWHRLSLIIRREHECVHYFTRRLFRSMQNNLMDEILADFMGITVASGTFRANWMLYFMGLENFPKYRNGGRLENYRGSPPLSNGAFQILQKLFKAVTENLQICSEKYTDELNTPPGRIRVLTALAYMTLEEMASSEMTTRIKQILKKVPIIPHTSPLH